MDAPQGEPQLDQFVGLQGRLVQVDEDAPIVESLPVADGAHSAPESVVGLESLLRQNHVGNDGEENVEKPGLLRVIDQQTDVFIGRVAHGSRLRHYCFQLIHEKDETPAAELLQKSYERTREIVCYWFCSGSRKSGGP